PKHVAMVERITPAIEAMAGAAGSELSRGGMQTKIEAAKIATGAGAHLIIASGRVDHPLRAVAKGARSTWFMAAGNPVAALRRGTSLLPAGVVRVEGSFDRGDAVIIRGPDGMEVGRGLCAYDASDAQKIRGRSSADIASILGFSGRAEMVHRDNLVISRH